MEKKLKAFRIDNGINSLFIEQCQARNLNQDKVFEMLAVRWLKELKKRPINNDTRFKSVRNKLTGFQMVKELVTGKFAQRFNTFLETSDDETFARYYLKILEFVKPKMQRVESADYNLEDNVITIIHSYTNSE